MPTFDESPLDGSFLRSVFSCFPSGVIALAALREGMPVGIAASAFTAVSLDPPLVSVCVQRSSATWPVLRRRPRLGVSVLGEEHDEVCLQLASKEGDRFRGVAWEQSPSGGVFIQRSTAWLDCSVHREVPAGDHVLVLLKIHGVHAELAAEPLVFHGSRFRRLVRV